MPYKWVKRKYGHAKRAVKHTYGAGKSAYSMASHALKAANAVRKLINVEYKAFDDSANYSTQTTTASVSCLSNIPQGDTSITRDGYSVKVLKLQVRYAAYCDPDAGGASQGPTLFRFMIVQALSDVAPTAALVLNGVTDVLSYRNIDGTAQFRVLHDKIMYLSESDSEQKFVELNFKAEQLPCQHITWDQTDTAGTSFRKGGIYVLAISDTVANPPIFQWRSRIRFTDN